MYNRIGKLFFFFPKLNHINDISKYFHILCGTHFGNRCVTRHTANTRINRTIFVCIESYLRFYFNKKVQFTREPGHVRDFSLNKWFRIDFLRKKRLFIHRYNVWKIRLNDGQRTLLIPISSNALYIILQQLQRITRSSISNNTWFWTVKKISNITCNIAYTRITHETNVYNI